MKKRLMLAVWAAAALSLSAFATTDPKQLQGDYATLQQWQYSAGTPLTKPVTLTRDTLTITLTSGTVHFAQPVGGRVTGVVFEGDGHFTMTVPDRFELAQLRRFAEKPSLEKIDEPMTQLVLRASDDTIEKAFPDAAKAAGFTKNDTAEKRQQHWLIDYGADVDARVITSTQNAGALTWVAEAKTQNFDWLTYDYSSARTEEARLIRFRNAYPETWLSIDRAEDRAADGRPGPRLSQNAKLSFIDVKADLTKYGSNAGSGETRQRSINAHFSIEEELSSLAAGVSALALELDPTAQNLAVKDENGQPLVFLRDHIGARNANLGNKVWDSTFTVLLPSPMKANEERHIRFDYDLEIPNYAAGNSWYPTVGEGFDDHTARLELVTNKKNEVRSMGRLDTTRDDANTKTTIWIVDKPTKMITFATAERYVEETIDVKGLPQVVSFGWASGMDVKTRVRNSGADVANSLLFYQTILDSPASTTDGDKFYVTSITGYHGQAFDNFLHLAESSYSESPGASELFRGHEVAHEWFGHRVGWRTYRDQWLSEALAEYASMMFVQSTVKDGPKYFNEILQTYDNTLKGDLRGAFSKFNRPWLMEIRGNARARVGPIGHGYRASTAEMPIGYEVQTYLKGPLVVHMLRELLLARTHNDDAFLKVLRDYVKDNSGKLASTADFQKAIEKNVGGDWSWFFNDWIYSADIPTVRWSYKTEPAAQGVKLSLTVKRSDAPPDFTFLVPVRVEFDNGKAGMFFVNVKENEQTITKDLPAQPKNVVFAPNYSLLANIRKE
jgi:hypothetical protein